MLLGTYYEIEITILYITDNFALSSKSKQKAKLRRREGRDTKRGGKREKEERRRGEKKGGDEGERQGGKLVLILKH